MKKLTDKQLETIRLLAWEKIKNHPDYAFDTDIGERIRTSDITDVAEALDLFYEVRSKYKVSELIDPDADWEEIKDKALSLFLPHLPELLGYSEIRKLCKPLSGQIFGGFSSPIRFPNEWTGKRQRFLPQQWESRYEVWDLVEQKNYSMEDVKLTLRRPLSTAYRLYNEAGKFIIGDSFKGKKRDRETDWNHCPEHELRYMQIVDRIQLERIFPYSEHLRLQQEYLSRHEVTRLEPELQKKEKKRVIKLDPLEYRGTTGEFTRIMGNWNTHLDSQLDLEKIHFIRDRLRELGKIPQGCKAHCLFCQVQDEWHFLETEEFKRDLEILGINALWKHRCKHRLVENTLYRKVFFRL